jgi:beta-lactamase class A
MVLQSDNTATDVLISMVGRDAVLDAMAACGVPAGLNVPLRTTRELIETAWGDPAGSPAADQDDVLRDRSLLTPMHQAGLDYVAPLTAVTEAMRRLSRHPWTPWSDQPPTGAQRSGPLPRPPLMYKGGSAPGVLSAAWCRRAASGPRALAFAINSPTPLGALEELYAFTCAERTLQELGIR